MCSNTLQGCSPAASIIQQSPDSLLIPLLLSFCYWDMYTSESEPHVSVVMDLIVFIAPSIEYGDIRFDYIWRPYLSAKKSCAVLPNGL